MTEFVLYTDGSYSKEAALAAISFVAVQNGVVIHTDAMQIQAKSAFVCETSAICFAVNWAIAQGSTDVTVYCDNRSVVMLATGESRPHKAASRLFTDFIQSVTDDLNLSVYLIKGHAGHYENMLAHEMAQELTAPPTPPLPQTAP